MRRGLLAKSLQLSDFLGRFCDLPQLLFRLMLGYRFYKPALFKVQNIDFVTTWFSNLGYPLPTLLAWSVAISQLACFILLPLGLWTRLVAFVQSCVMLVAIVSVHWKNGFSNANDGIEIPLYYLAMLFSLVMIGPGRISLDYLVMTRWRKSVKPYDVPA